MTNNAKIVSLYEMRKSFSAVKNCVIERNVVYLQLRTLKYYE